MDTSLRRRLTHGVVGEGPRAAEAVQEGWRGTVHRASLSCEPRAVWFLARLAVPTGVDHTSDRYDDAGTASLLSVAAQGPRR